MHFVPIDVPDICCFTLPYIYILHYHIYIERETERQRDRERVIYVLCIYSHEKNPSALLIITTMIHHVPKCMSCHKAIVVITRRAHCFYDCIYIMLILLLWDLNVLCIVDHLWPDIHFPYLHKYTNLQKIKILTSERCLVQFQFSYHTNNKLNFHQISCFQKSKQLNKILGLICKSYKL